MTAIYCVGETIEHMKRQALHARRLGLAHPESGEWMEWEAPLPEDMLELLAQLRLNEDTA